MGEKKLNDRDMQFLLLALVPAYFIIVGFILQPEGTIVWGLLEIMREPDFLITDYFVIGGVGAAFINAGTLCLLSIGIIYKLNMKMDGHTITSSFMMFGFSLFGKNLLNIWLILIGVALYAKYHKTSLSRYIYVGLYGTSLSPLITQVMQIADLVLPLKICLCIVTGIIIGFVLPPLATHCHFAHKGYSLYNVGFAGGVIATVIVSVFRSFGLKLETRLIWSTGNNPLFLVILSILFVGMIAVGFLLDRDVLSHYRNILKYSGIGGTDYLELEGEAATLVNMGVNGIVCTSFFCFAGGELNGPTIGSIFTILGFSATGKHAFNILPVMTGVWFASLVKIWDISTPSASLAFLLSTTLAPIAGEFGIITGIIAGFLHSSVAMNVSVIHGGMNLYNNGFAGGLIAIFMVPVIQSIVDRRARARGGLSL